jgi:hypothetical protein
MQYSTTHENIPVCITINKQWWEFWKPKEINIKISATVNRDLGIAIMSTWSSY